MAIGTGIGVFLIVIFVLFFSTPALSNTAIIAVARSNATVQEIFQGKEHIVTDYYEGISGIPDYECQIGRCISVAFSPAADPEKITVGVWVNKDTMKIADIRSSEDYLIMKANESPEGKLFLKKYPDADVSTSLGHWDAEIRYGVADSLHGLSLFVNITYTGEVTGVSAMCESHSGNVDRIFTRVDVSDYIDRGVCPVAD